MKVRWFSWSGSEAGKFKRVLQLVKPSPKYKRSFVAAEIEFRRVDSKKRLSGRKLSRGFDAYLVKLRGYEQGKNLPKGYVPATNYWLVRGPRFIGEVTIRHRLTPALRKEGGHIGYGIRPSERKKRYGTKICALALKKAKAMGIRRALLTCNDSNTGSWKIIEANGGKLHSKIRHHGVLKRRYWITIR